MRQLAPRKAKIYRGYYASHDYNVFTVQFATHLLNQRKGKHTLVVCFFFSSARRVGIFSPSMTFGEGNGRARHKTVNNRFCRSDVSRCESDEPSVPRRRATTQKQTGQWKIPSPQHLLSFTHSNAITLKYAKLKGTISSSLSPFTTLCMENGDFYLSSTTKSEKQYQSLGI